MTLELVYKIIGHYTSKHYSGKTLTPELFTDVLIKENIELFAKVFQDVKVSMEKNDSTLSEAVSLIGGINIFLEYTTGALVDGVMTFPANYCYYDAFYLPSLGLTRPVEVLLEADAQRRKTSMLSRSLLEHPICVITGNKAMFTPKIIGQTIACSYSYLRNPLDPFYDYCIKVDSNTEVYMPVGSVIVARAAEWDLKESPTGSVIASNVTHLLFPAQAYTSRTVELEWDDTEIVTIIKSITEKEGVSLRDLELYQMEKAAKQ